MVMLAVTVVIIMRSRNLFGVVILGGIYSFLMATVLVAMDAVDVAMTEAAVVVPLRTGNRQTIPSLGVNCVFPPNGINTVPRPIVLSKRSESPF